MDNLPTLDVLVGALNWQLLKRWQRHVAEELIGADEQTSQRVRLKLQAQDVDGALYEVLRAREERRVVVEGSEPSPTVHPANSKSDEATASAISSLNAHRAAVDGGVNVRLLRESSIGRPEPFSRTEAWAFLSRAERVTPAIPWERLHTGWDRTPIFSQNQQGEHASLSFRDEQGLDHQFRAGPGSVLAGLWVWSNYLFTTYNWPRSQAAWFLLTGEPPQLLPMTMTIEEGLAGPLTSTITVTVLAYGASGSVPEALTLARRRLLGRRRGPLALARHVMTQFVDQQFEGEGDRPSWKEVWRRWNTFAPPEWRLDQRRVRYPNWRAMLDAYRREKAARGASESRDSVARDKESRSRRVTPAKRAKRARKEKVARSRRQGATDRA